MTIKIFLDANAPTASLELMISRPLPDFDLDTVEAPIPRDIDPILASQGFKDLLDEARAILLQEFSSSALEIVQLTGAICHDRNIHRPGIWLVVRETHPAGPQMSSPAKERIASAAESLRTRLQLS